MKTSTPEVGNGGYPNMQVSHAVGAVAAVVGLLAGIVSPEGVVATAVESKDVARVLASRKR
jgi:hypothetical protein